MVSQGGFLPSTTFLSSANTKKLEGSERETSKQNEDKETKVISTKLPRYKAEHPGTVTPYEIKANATAFSSAVSDYSYPEKSSENDKKRPKLTVYSRPLLPLPKDFGFRLSEVLDLEQRVTEANFPTISTFTDNFEADIDWTGGKR